MVVASIPVKFAPDPKKLVAVTELIPDIFVELSPTIFPFAVISPLNVPVDPATVPPDIFPVTFPVTLPVTFPVTLPVNAPNKPVAVTELIPDIFVESSPIIFPFAFILPPAVMIPVLILGTSKLPNNFPFNTKSPLIV